MESFSLQPMEFGDENFAAIDENEQIAMSLNPSLNPIRRAAPDVGAEYQILENVSAAIRGSEYKTIFTKIEGTIFGIVADLSGKRKSIADILFDPDRVEGLVYFVIAVGIFSIIARGLRD